MVAITRPGTSRAAARPSGSYDYSDDELEELADNIGNIPADLVQAVCNNNYGDQGSGMLEHCAASWAAYDQTYQNRLQNVSTCRESSPMPMKKPQAAGVSCPGRGPALRRSKGPDATSAARDVPALRVRARRARRLTERFILSEAKVGRTLHHAQGPYKRRETLAGCIAGRQAGSRPMGAIRELRWPSGERCEH
jgi:hypothetical protein